MKKEIKYTIYAAFILYICISLFLTFKPLPQNVSYESPIYYIDDKDVLFLYDSAYYNEINLTIFPHLFASMQQAQEFIIADMFLMTTSNPPSTTNLNNTEELIYHLSNGPPQRVLITDPLNTFYGSYTPEFITQAKQAGVDVHIVNHAQLRPSNVLYSTIYYTSLWKANFLPHIAFIPHPFGHPTRKITLQSVLTLLNAQANHRKTAVMDYEDTYISYILSANPHNPSSLHSNIGFAIKGDFAQELIITENAIADFTPPTIKQTKATTPDNPLQVQLLTEGKIRRSIVNDIKQTKQGDTIDIAMFYFSERQIIQAIKSASKRGVIINIVLDPNKDAFNREKNGVPNRQTALELQKYHQNINVRWYDTQGEQFHTKMLVITTPTKVIVHGGSANFTRRNLADLNLETNVRIQSPHNTRLANDVITYMQRIQSYTLDYSAYQDNNIFLLALARFQEWSGLSTF